jgi:hypothetical protein
MGRYEGRFGISLAGSRPLSSAPPWQEPSFRQAPVPSAAARLSSLTRTRQLCGRFCAIIRTSLSERIRHAAGGASPTT